MDLPLTVEGPTMFTTLTERELRRLWKRMGRAYARISQLPEYSPVKQDVVWTLWEAATELDYRDGHAAW